MGMTSEPGRATLSHDGEPAVLLESPRYSRLCSEGSRHPGSLPPYGYVCMPSCAVWIEKLLRSPKLYGAVSVFVLNTAIAIREKHSCRTVLVN